jgi:alpha-tubulin suppressor-like RCC1 family protein
MYPKPEGDLTGWVIESIGCGKASVVVAADKSVIAFGGNVQHRELGLGLDGPKTASRPRKVDALEGIEVVQVACGLGHTMLLAEADGSDGVAALDSWGDEGGKRKRED